MAVSSTPRMICRLFLKESGLLACGSARGEAVIREIVEFLVDCRKKDPISKRMRGALGTHTSAAAGSRRCLWRADGHLAKVVDLGENMSAQSRLEYTPMHLEKKLQDAVLTRVQRDHNQAPLRDRLGRKVFDALDFTKEDATRRRKQCAASGVREALSEWLESADGMAWRLERRRLMGHSEDEDEEDEEQDEEQDED